MKRSQEQELIRLAPKGEELHKEEEKQELRRRDWLVLIVLYPIPAPIPDGGKPSGFKRLLEVLSVLLKLAGMAYALYQAVQGGGS